jgi:hypothetical protein
VEVAVAHNLLARGIGEINEVLRLVGLQFKKAGPNGKVQFQRSRARRWRQDAKILPHAIPVVLVFEDDGAGVGRGQVLLYCPTDVRDGLTLARRLPKGLQPQREFPGFWAPQAEIPGLDVEPVLVISEAQVLRPIGRFVDRFILYSSDVVFRVSDVLINDRHIGDLNEMPGPGRPTCQDSNGGQRTDAATDD